ncbi:MAG: group I intron-associated PD-(D/E)XK endonuclease [Actinomycetota bacterium]
MPFTPHTLDRVAYPKGAPHPKLIGDRCTAMVLARLLEVFEVILLPFGENQRYDLLIDADHRFVRVQCKTGRLRNGAIKFATCSTNYHHPNREPSVPYRRHYRGNADVFGVHCPENDHVYLVPVSHVGARSGVLRVEPTRNNQAARIRWARDYEIWPRVRERPALFELRRDTLSSAPG